MDQSAAGDGSPDFSPVFSHRREQPSGPPGPSPEGTFRLTELEEDFGEGLLRSLPRSPGRFPYLNPLDRPFGVLRPRPAVVSEDFGSTLLDEPTITSSRRPTQFRQAAVTQIGHSNEEEARRAYVQQLIAEDAAAVARRRGLEQQYLERPWREAMARSSFGGGRSSSPAELAGLFRGQTPEQFLEEVTTRALSRRSRASDSCPATGAGPVAVRFWPCSD